MKKVLELLLMLLSGSVATWLFVNHAAPWGIIFIYWTTLTIKNAYDVFKKQEMRSENKD